jgi:folate-binding protein YgfZ
MDVSNYDALTTGCGLISRAERGRILLEGSDRRSLLQGLVTNDVQALEPGSGVYSAWLTPQGRMIADLNVIETGSALLLDVPRELTPDLVQRLEDSIFAEEVRVRDASEEWAQVAVAGPEAERAVRQADAIRPLVAHRHTSIPVTLIDLYVRAEDERRLLESLAEGGAVRVGPDAVEAFRIEAAIPRWGADLDDGIIPLEAGIEGRAISFAKGCYVGQEVIVRVLHRGHGRVARRLVSLTLPGVPADRLPARGAALRADGREVGHLTSVAWTPRRGIGVALGYVQRDYVAPGTELTVGMDRARVN